MDVLQNQPIVNTTDWNSKTLLKFAKIDTIKNALVIMATQNTYGSTRPKWRSDKKIVPKGTQGWAAKVVKGLRGVGKSGAWLLRPFVFGHPF